MHYMSRAQKGIVSNTRGTNHQSLIDTIVTRDYKVRQTNNCTAWTDYKRTYDLMRHTHE